MKKQHPKLQSDSLSVQVVTSMLGQNKNEKLGAKKMIGTSEQASAAWNRKQKKWHGQTLHEQIVFIESNIYSDRMCTKW